MPWARAGALREINFGEADDWLRQDRFGAERFSNHGCVTIKDKDAFGS
jgi:hypothetical protein